MLTRRSLVLNVSRMTKFCSDIQETRFGKKSFTQQCLMPSLFGMKMHYSSSAHGILINKKVYRLPCVCLPICSNRNVFTRSKKEASLTVKDKIPSGYILIYKAPMDNYVKYGQWCTSVGIGGTVAISLYEFYYFSLHQIGNSSTSSLSYVEFISMLIGLASTVTVLHLFLNRFTVRIYHNSLNDSYIAVFFDSLGLVSKVYFNKDQIEKLSIRWPIPWKRHLFSLNGKTAYLNEIHFRLPADYNAFLKLNEDS